MSNERTTEAGALAVWLSHPALADGALREWDGDLAARYPDGSGSISLAPWMVRGLIAKALRAAAEEGPREEADTADDGLAMAALEADRAAVTLYEHGQNAEGAGAALAARRIRTLIRRPAPAESPESPESAAGRCQHQLRREAEKCRHGFHLGSTCERCIAECARCWDDCASPGCPRPLPAPQAPTRLMPPSRPRACGWEEDAMASEHVVKLSRYERGRTMITNRTLYGYDLECSCGWSTRVNGTKREANAFAKDHAKDGK